MSDLSLGQKIRQTRKNKEISINEFSTITNLSPSFISQLERDLVSPSISTIRIISKALGVPIFYLIGEDDSKGEIVRKNNGKRFTFPNSKVVFELLSPDLNREMEVIKITLGKGESTFDELISHKGEEVDYCIEGMLEVTVGHEKYILTTGDTIYFKSDLPHMLSNIGDGVCIVLSVVTPPSF